MNTIEFPYRYWGGAEQSESALVTSAQSGSLASFNTLVLKYQDVIYRTALRMMGQHDLAEDAAQDAFISAHQHLASFHGGSLKAWLLRIVVNKCYDELRRAQHNTHVSLNATLQDGSGDDEPRLGIQDHAPSVEASVEASERNETIQKCLERLPTDFRIIIVLVDIEELSYNEASAILKVPLGTVKSRLARARLSLRQELMLCKNL